MALCLSKLCVSYRSTGSEILKSHNAWASWGFVYPQKLRILPDSSKYSPAGINACWIILGHRRAYSYSMSSDCCSESFSSSNTLAQTNTRVEGTMTEFRSFAPDQASTTTENKSSKFAERRHRIRLFKKENNNWNQKTHIDCLKIKSCIKTHCRCPTFNCSSKEIRSLSSFSIIWVKAVALS